MKIEVESQNLWYNAMFFTFSLKKEIETAKKERKDST